MMGLSDGERISMIGSAVLIQYTRATDRRPDRQTDRQTELAWHIRAIAMLSRVKKKGIDEFPLQKLLSISTISVVYTKTATIDHT